jgi:hypothetical protein
MKNAFVANGFNRWSNARNAKARETIRAIFAGENQPRGWLDKVRLWFRTEWECLSRQDDGEKSSPKILW